jgi:high-affinity iron transporter
MTSAARKLLLALATLLTFALPSLSSAAEADVRRVWQLLDYLSVDYAGAVKDGKVLSESEFSEMKEFAHSSREKLAALEAKPEQAALVNEADALSSAIEAKSSPDTVSTLAKGLANHLLAVYPVPAAPAAVPDVKLGAKVFQAQCAACHGATGNGDGPVGLQLNPHPVAFTNTERARQRSVFALYQVVTQGIGDTPMASFAQLPENERWAVATYIGGFAHTAATQAQGEALWKSDEKLRGQVGGLDGFVKLTEADLAKSIGSDKAAEVSAYLHANPQALTTELASNFGLARQRLQESVQAYASGDAKHATELALSSYLDGVEPLEQALAARDNALKEQIETAMSSFRSLISQGASASDLKQQAAAIDALFVRSESVLGHGTSDASAAFFGSFTILLREGIEALLVVVAMIAFLRKAERPDMLRYVHVGWVGALAAGAVTWAIATFLVGISGANREVTEGLSSLFAAVVLLSVGMWMHQKSVAGRWQVYLQAKLSAALTKQSAWFMFGLSFVAVYREVFETILFYAALWGQGNNGAILAGLAVAALALVGLSFALLRYSAKLPIGKFFSFSSMLVALLALVLTGKGIAALQEAGWVGAHALSTPRIDLLGIYPSTQTLLGQLVVLVVLALVSR